MHMSMKSDNMFPNGFIPVKCPKNLGSSQNGVLFKSVVQTNEFSRLSILDVGIYPCFRVKDRNSVAST